MTSLLVAFLISFAVSLLLILLSFTPWAQANLRWITSIAFYLILGAILGMSMMGIAIAAGDALAPLVEVKNEWNIP